MVGALPSSSSYPRVLLGIFSAISDRERRHMIRSTMLHSPPPSFQHSVARHRILAARALRYAARQAPHRHHAPWGMQLELADR